VTVAASRSSFRRVAILAGALAIAAIANFVMSEAKPSSAVPAINVPLRAPLASLPEALGDWTRATDADDAPIADTRLPEGGEACTGTPAWLGRTVARDGRFVGLQVGYHSGGTLRSAQCTPERCWDAGGASGGASGGAAVGAAGGTKLLSPATLVELPSGLEVMLVEFEQHPEGGRHLAAYTFLFDGKRRAERDTPGLATSHWTQVQLDGRFPPEEAATARRTFLADVEDLMPRVVGELQNTCLPLPVEAVPTA
jgi:hypothetical protein